MSLSHQNIEAHMKSSDEHVCLLLPQPTKKQSQFGGKVDVRSTFATILVREEQPAWPNGEEREDGVYINKALLLLCLCQQRIWRQRWSWREFIRCLPVPGFVTHVRNLHVFLQPWRFCLHLLISLRVPNIASQGCDCYK